MGRLQIGGKAFVLRLGEFLQPMKRHKRHGFSSPTKSNPFQISIVICLLSSLVLRYGLIDFETGDLDAFTNWYDFIVNNGYFYALKHKFANYTPAYHYLLLFSSLLGLPKIVAIKLISIVFDFVCAFFVYKIVRLKYPEGMAPIFAALLTLFSPTVVMNGSLWGQCDVIYTTGLLACIYFLLIKRESYAFFAFGLALAFKLQAIFLMPLLLVLFVRKEVSWKSFFLIPLVYLAVITPAWLVGRPLDELLLIYVEQAGQYTELTMNAPNLYQWIPQTYYDIFLPTGLIWTGLLVCGLVVMAMRSRVKITKEMLILLATLSVTVCPYFLPKMHERYFFAADVISIVFAFYSPRHFYIPVVIGMGSFFFYFPYLFGSKYAFALMPYLALALLAVIIVVGREFLVALHGDRTTPKTER